MRLSILLCLMCARADAREIVPRLDPVQHARELRWWGGATLVLGGMVAAVAIGFTAEAAVTHPPQPCAGGEGLCLNDFERNRHDFQIGIATAFWIATVGAAATGGALLRRGRVLPTLAMGREGGVLFLRGYW